jgi:hypothetical protein
VGRSVDLRVLSLATLAACTGSVDGATPGSDGGGRDSGTSRRDGGSSDDGGSPGDGGSIADGGAAPDGGSSELQPVFVAIADGGWTATSCDMGRTWSAREYSPIRDDHSEWTAFGGIAYGNEAFVIGLGWGQPGHVLRSTDGGTWEDLADDRFLRDGSVEGFDASTGGVVFTGTEFLMLSEFTWRSTDGRTWNTSEDRLPPGSHQLRQFRAFPSAGLVVASVETQYGDEHPLGNFVVVSDDGGRRWTEGTGYDPECSNGIQHWGDIEVLGSTLVVATGRICRSLDAGETWTVVDLPGGGQLNDLVSDGEALYAFSGERVLRSTDGASWNEVGEIGGRIDRAAYGAGTFVAVTGGGSVPRFFRSDDAVTWEEASFSTSLGGVYMRDFTVGYTRSCAP